MQLKEYFRRIIPGSEKDYLNYSFICQILISK